MFQTGIEIEADQLKCVWNDQLEWFQLRADIWSTDHNRAHQLDWLFGNPAKNSWSYYLQRSIDSLRGGSRSVSDVRGRAFKCKKRDGLRLSEKQSSGCIFLEGRTQRTDLALPFDLILFYLYFITIKTNWWYILSHLDEVHVRSDKIIHLAFMGSNSNSVLFL